MQLWTFKSPRLAWWSFQYRIEKKIAMCCNLYCQYFCVIHASSYLHLFIRCDFFCMHAIWSSVISMLTVVCSITPSPYSIKHISLFKRIKRIMMRGYYQHGDYFDIIITCRIYPFQGKTKKNQVSFEALKTYSKICCGCKTGKLNISWSFESFNRFMKRHDKVNAYYAAY